MNFDNVLEIKNYFQTLSEAKSFRSILWSKVDKSLKQLEEDLFDIVDLEEGISIANDFFDKSIYSLDKVDVIVSLTKEQFEYVIEENIIQKYISDNINYYVFILDENKYYNYNGSFFKEKTLNINFNKNYE